MLFRIFIFITTSLVLFSNDSNAQSKQRNTIEVDYRDTIGTYAQIFLEMADTNIAIKDESVFKLTLKTEKSKDRKIFTIKTNTNFSETFKIEPGLYDVQFAKQTYKNILIKDDSLSMIRFKLYMGNLMIRYLNDSNTIMPNTAKVYKRYSTEDGMIQPCSMLKKYMPGTYYIEVNTLPVTKFMIELGYCENYEIQLPKPAKVMITIPKDVENMKVYEKNSDELIYVYTFKENHTTANPLCLQPSLYMLEWEYNKQKFSQVIRLHENETRDLNFE